MPKGIPNKKWEDKDFIKKFLELCDKSQKPSVDWDVFRKFDEKGSFKEFDIFALSSKFRKYRFIGAGLCWQCGKNKPDPGDAGGLCKVCRKYCRDHNNKKV